MNIFKGIDKRRKTVIKQTMGFENKNISIPFHWSGEVLTITFFCILVLLGTIIYLGIFKSWPDSVLWLKYLIIIFLSITIVAVGGFMPIRLKANEREIVLCRMLSSLKIPINKVVEITPITSFYIDGSIKTFGSDGMFGYIGNFKNKRLRKYTMYATELKNLVLVRTTDKTYVFSCTRYRDFISNVEQKRSK